MANPRPSGPHRAMSLHNLHRMLALLALPAFFLLARPMGAQVTCDRAGCGTVRDARQNIVCFTPAPIQPADLIHR